MSIYITGDCHGDFNKLSKKKVKGISFKKNDYLIICGDFGLCWAKDKEFEYNCKLFSQRPYTTLWVQGNHENYDMIKEYPIEEWNGGKVRHIVRDKVILLERGQYFTIEGKTFFTFGGARSHDISDGILDRDKCVDEQDYRAERIWFIKMFGHNGMWRENHVSWWKEEMPSQEEMDEGLRVIEEHNNEVDYIITHCASTITEQKLGYFDHDKFTDYLNYFEHFVKFRHWYFGHYHQDATDENDKHTVIYHNILKLTD